MTEALAPIGNLHASARIAAAGGFVAGSQNLGVLSAVSGGAGIKNITLAPGYAIDRNNAVCLGTVRGATNADKPNFRHLTDTTIEARTHVQGVLTDLAFDLRIRRIGVGAV